MKAAYAFALPALLVALCAGCGDDLCGNGRLDDDEDCDDGNGTDGDCCTDCEVEEECVCDLEVEPNACGPL